MATTDSSSDSAPVFKLSPVGQLVGLSAAGTTYPYHPSADPSAFALQTVLKAGAAGATSAQEHSEATVRGAMAGAVVASTATGGSS